MGQKMTTFCPIFILGDLGLYCGVATPRVGTARARSSAGARAHATRAVGRSGPSPLRCHAGAFVGRGSRGGGYSRQKEEAGCLPS